MPGDFLSAVVFLFLLSLLVTSPVFIISRNRKDEFPERRQGGGTWFATEQVDHDKDEQV